VAGGRGRGLVDPQQPAEQPLGTRAQREQHSHRARADEQGDEDVGGVVGADGDPSQGDQQGGAGGGQPPAAGQEQAAGGGRGGDGGVVGEEGAVAGPAADGVDSGECPVGAGAEVKVAGELVQPEGGRPAHGGQGDDSEAGRISAAQRLDGQDGQQQRRCGGQDGGHQQDQQA
jgi:hypothetical protein